MKLLEAAKALTQPSPEAVDPASPVQKASLKSFEIWVKLALAVAGVLMDMGIIADGSPLAKYIGAAFTIAGVLGISISRTAMTLSGNKTAAAVKSAEYLADAAAKLENAAALKAEVLKVSVNPPSPQAQ